jgi:hypothetical protein
MLWQGGMEADMTFLRITILCVSALTGLIAMMAAVAAKGQFDPGQMACKVVKVPTPANQPPSPYTRNLFDGTVQAWVPPVPRGFRGKIVMVPTQVCH